MRFSLREVIFTLILLGLPVGYYFLVVHDRNDKIDAARQDIKEYQAMIATVDQHMADIPDMEARIGQIQGAISDFEAMLPSDREVDTLLREVWDLAGEHKLNAKSVRPDKIVPAAQYAELPIKMVIEGDFDGFYGFIQDIEKLPRITRMPRMKITKMEKEDQGIVKVELTLSIFFDGGAKSRPS